MPKRAGGRAGGRAACRGSAVPPSSRGSVVNLGHLAVSRAHPHAELRPTSETCSAADLQNAAPLPGWRPAPAGCGAPHARPASTGSGLWMVQAWLGPGRVVGHEREEEYVVTVPSKPSFGRWSTFWVVRSPGSRGLPAPRAGPSRSGFRLTARQHTRRLRHAVRRDMAPHLPIHKPW